jgi:NAD(P)H dehydrogenase (quinone)
MKKAMLEFCGIKPVKTTAIGSVRFLKLQQIRHWLEKAGKLGEGLK